MSAANIKVTETPDGEIAVTLGKRDAHLGMSIIIDREQAAVLHTLLEYTLYGEEQYQEWLARQAGLVVEEQIDQGGEVIPIRPGGAA